MISERVEAVKNSPQYKAYMEQMEQMKNGTVSPSNMGPYGPVAATVTPKEKTEEEIKREETKAKIEKRKAELNDMTLVDLKEIAKKLSLSGYSTMKKEELIENIIRITEDE